MIMRFLDKLKEEIRPDKEVIKEVDKIVDAINRLLKKEKVKATCKKGGSVAKGTFLKDDYDVDLFVIFDKQYKGKDISKILGKVLKNLKPKKVHGSRDYYQLSINSLNFEIVPVMKVKNYKEIENVTDMSPLHVDFVKKNSNKKIRDDIRLAKVFCKAQGVYGAESYIKGFSGHILDILVIHYGSFINLLKAAAKWKDKTIIDPEKYHDDVLFELNKSKTRGPLVIVDPVQPDRNAAAALGKEKYNIFRKAARDFLKRPSLSFFVKKKINAEELKKRAKRDYFISLNVKAKKGKEDVVGSKLKKAFDYLVKGLENNEFSIRFADWEWNKKQKAVFYFIIKKEKMSKEVIHEGPPIDRKEHVKLFKKLYKKTFTKKKKVYAKLKRKYMEPKKLINDLIKEKYIKDRVKEIK
jgi:tRNA nucleotidyltransferase (CCA-adding enzyme)